MRKARFRRLVGGATALVFSVSVLSVIPATSVVAATSVSVKPNATSEMDCNGHSPVYSSVKASMGGLCTDPIAVYDGTPTRFYDNGHYVGHDEPSVKFISSAAGSANDMTYLMRLAVDPKAAPTASSPKVSRYGELSPAPWFGLPICDAKSYPQNACTPDSDTNHGLGSPVDAGSAFMELQFYPPGFAPFVDGPSCDATHYCAALTIDSLECTFGFACNNNCIEPVNFAFLQLNGVPAGPPSPQLTDVSTLSPNRKTLMMNQGDVLQVTVRDTQHGLLTSVTDLSTRQSGFMVASAANGFMNTNIADCTGTPFDFHAEYNSALQQNQVPWAALEGGVLMQDEIGHFEPCSALTNPSPVNLSFPGGQTFSDPKVFQTCQGGLEGSSLGEGPCDATTGICVNATTENGAACPTNDSNSGVLCEFSDANCMPLGNRTAIVNGNPVAFQWPVAGCQDNVFQNGDLDFEGSSYQADWPDGSSGHPTSFQYLGPFTRVGGVYPTVQFETDVGASEILCNVATGAGCTAQPSGAAFYPFWTLGSLGSRSPGFLGSPGGATNGGHRLCLWNFGNVIPGTTVQSFGGTSEYGAPDVARFAGTLTSQPMPNPQFSGSCGI
jgi:hypothetical protein